MKVTIAPKYQSAEHFITALPSLFEQKGELIFRKRNVVKRFTTEWGTWIVKLYKKPHIIQRIAYTFWRPSKAMRAFQYAERFKSLGIDTPESIACIEQKECGLFATGYFISTECPHPSAFDVLHHTEQFDRKLADALTDFLVELHGKGILHGDLNLSNILYHTNQEGHYAFSLIDTNRSRFNPTLTQEECLNNLVRVTHRRELLQYIVEQYAQRRSWEVEACVKEVFKGLDKLERKGEMKEKIKRRKQ